LLLLLQASAKIEIVKSRINVDRLIFIFERF